VLWRIYSKMKEADVMKDICGSHVRVVIKAKFCIHISNILDSHKT